MSDVRKAPQCAAAHGGGFVFFLLSFFLRDETNSQWRGKVWPITVEGDILCSGAQWALVRM